uniref:Putative E3 ubiquitin-protein ligase SINA-like 9 n=1 Tax=Lygus hesperus TaxID=30085 RepID=A0A0A9ZDE5_LYGHE
MYNVQAERDVKSHSDTSYYQRFSNWLGRYFNGGSDTGTLVDDQNVDTAVPTDAYTADSIYDDTTSDNHEPIDTGRIVNPMHVGTGRTVNSMQGVEMVNPNAEISTTPPSSSLSHVEGTSISGGPNRPNLPVGSAVGGTATAAAAGNQPVSGGSSLVNAANIPSSCTLRLVDGMENARSVDCLPTASSCPTSTSMESNILWSITRVAFSSVPTSSIFLAESMTNINYDMDYATVNTYPYSITQVGLRNFSPFEQFLTARTSKFISHQFTFRWLVGFTPSAAITINQLPMFITGTLTSLVNSLLGPINNFINSIVPGLAYPLTNDFLSNLTVETITFTIPFQWSGAVTHLESQEVVATYSVTAPPQAHLLGRAIAHMGKTSVPFTLDVTRRVHVPAGIYGQTTGQLIAYDYRVPGVYDGAQLINTEFLIDAL